MSRLFKILSLFILTTMLYAAPNFPKLTGRIVDNANILSVATKNHLKNNGVLLIVAPNERKVRIEVGYGLEGDLTDAISSVIIQTKILPYFKKSDFDGGVLSGVKAIVGVIEGTYKPDIKKQKNISPITPELFFGLFFLLIILEKLIPIKYRGVVKNIMPSSFAGLFAYLISISAIIGIAVGAFVFLLLTFIGGFGGGFSGGGGGFGGGGASGGW